MHKFYTYITQPRLNLVDFVVVLMTAGLVEMKYYFIAGLVFGFGVIGSTLFQRKIQRINEEKKEIIDIDRLWKGYAALGQTVNAIKEYRRLHDASLKDAVDAVRLYQAEVGSCADRNGN